jgi:hypothetical protein
MAYYRAGRRRWTLRGVIDPASILPGMYPAPIAANNQPLPRPAACSWYDYIWPTQACSLALGQQQIQSVPANAAAANAAAVAAGMPAPYTVPAIQAAADVGSEAFAAENTMIFNPPPSTDPSTWPWYYWALIAGGLKIIVFSAAKASEPTSAAA